MLIFLRHALAYLAVPKTGTTAIETALRPQAEIIFTRRRKHITAARYRNKVAPFLEDTFGVRPVSVAVMREPVDQLRSWFRYRAQDRLLGTMQSTAGIDFDTFVTEAISDAPPPRAQIGRQFRFLTDGRGALCVNHLCAYEAQEKLIAFLSERLEMEIDVPPRNVSPMVEAELSPQTLSSLKAARPEDFELHARLLAQGGQMAL
ncbi:MAG: hypothetical protein AAF943_05930 [Pseudomonadota bacterium]